MKPLRRPHSPAPLPRPPLAPASSVPAIASAPKPAIAKPLQQTSAGPNRNREVAEQYFRAFASKDLTSLEKLYRPDATFHDDMFDLSKRESVLTMWRKTPSITNFKSEILSVNGDEVRAKWSCDYVMFGHPVHNEIDSTLKIAADGLIQSQNEHWDRSKWMSQALPAIPRWAQPIAYFVMRPLFSALMGG
jgi:ketosteroid isomerase-like protein